MEASVENREDVIIPSSCSLLSVCWVRVPAGMPNEIWIVAEGCANYPVVPPRKPRDRTQTFRDLVVITPTFLAFFPPYVRVYHLGRPQGPKKQQRRTPRRQWRSRGGREGGAKTPQGSADLTIHNIFDCSINYMI